MASTTLKSQQPSAEPACAIRDQAPMPAAFRSTSNSTLAALLDHSLDCIKLIGVDGTVQYMNRNGQCAMEIDDFSAVWGARWSDMWPEESRRVIDRALSEAALGLPVRFEAVCPTAKGSPRWWDVSVSQVRDVSGQLLGYLSSSRDVTDSHVAREALEIAAAELRHRLKNSYAMVGGLLAAFSRGDPARELFVREMRERLSALGVAQTLFIGREHAPCDIRTLLPAVLEPFETPDCTISVADLPEFAVDQAKADAVALVLGELAVNSAKHGGLSANGTVLVSAARQGDGVTIIWEETSSRPVESHSRNGGQGLRLMQRILNARGGQLEIEWRDFGLSARISLPAG